MDLPIYKPINWFFCALGWRCTKLLTSTIFHTLKYWYQYTDLGLTHFFFIVSPFVFEKIFFFPQNLKKPCRELFFGEALIVVPLFLDICLDIFGACINQKHLFGTYVLETEQFWKKMYF